MATFTDDETKIWRGGKRLAQVYTVSTHRTGSHGKGILTWKGASGYTGVMPKSPRSEGKLNQNMIITHPKILIWVPTSVLTLNH